MKWAVCFYQLLRKAPVVCTMVRLRLEGGIDEFIIAYLQALFLYILPAYLFIVFVRYVIALEALPVFIAANKAQCKDE